MYRVSTVWLTATLTFACTTGSDDLRPRQAGDLQAEYEAKEQQLDQCLQGFGDCVAQAADPAGIAGCADELEGCLGGGLPGGTDSGTDTGGSTDGGTDDGGGSESGTESGTDTGGDPPADDCQALLDGCLADPFNFDPTCLDGYEQCVQDQVDADLQGLCDQLEAECQMLGIPNFDCSTVCP